MLQRTRGTTTTSDTGDHHHHHHHILPGTPPRKSLRDTSPSCDATASTTDLSDDSHGIIMGASRSEEGRRDDTGSDDVAGDSSNMINSNHPKTKSIQYDDNDEDDHDAVKVHNIRCFSCNLPCRPRRSRRRHACRQCANSSRMIAVIVAAAVWFGMGVVAICTTKVLLSSRGVPPLLLTFQQLTLSSILLRIVLRLRDGGAQPLPWQPQNICSNSSNGTGQSNTTTTAVCKSVDANGIVTATTCSSSSNKNGGNSSTDEVESNKSAPPVSLRSTLSLLRQTPNLEFILAGLFNGLDFLASATAFSSSAPSFVETIKSSDPISTTAVALFFGMDTIRSRTESVALFILCLGVFLSTLGNQSSSGEGQHETTGEVTIWDSAFAAMTVLAANFCFAFRAVNQKRYQQHCKVASSCAAPMDDVNLLCRMQQTGATALFPLAILFYVPTLWSVWSASSMSEQMQYLQLALGNSVAFVSYNLAACMVLSQVSMVTYSGLNCVRRMFCVLCTCAFFGVPITWTGGLGIIACFSGFGLFTYQRRPGAGVAAAKTDSTQSNNQLATPLLSSAASPSRVSPSSRRNGPHQV